MLSIKRIKNVYPRCKPSSLLSLSHGFSHISSPRASRLPHHPFAASTAPRISGRFFSGSTILREDGANAPEPQSERDIEKVVRETKQRFRDTLPTGYLNEQEYALYVRLYGPPLRETSPEDVGIPTHADMGTPPPQPENQGTALRELEDGGFEEIIFGKTAQQPSEGSEEEAAAGAGSESEGLTIVDKAPGYIDVIARNPREHSALQKLMQDFEAAQERQRELDLAAAEAEEMQAQMPDSLDKEEVEEFDEDEDFDEDDDDEANHRFHPFTLAGKFAINPVQLVLPKNELIHPIDRLLDRTHLDHVKAAAEAAFGGQRLPLSPASSPKKAGGMVGVGLPPDQKFMTEIEADAFLATYIPPAYASAASILRETRKRLGSDWIQLRLKQGGGMSVLDAGAGGAGLVAWEEIVRAEWDLLKDQGAVDGKQCPGRKTVIVGSDRLRHRLKSFLHDTTFLPRLPDYEHSGDTQGEHLEAGRKPQPRKSYDLIIASHLFLKEDVEHKRQAVLNNLWSLLSKDGGVLVVIEKAHPRGFEAMAHVRDTVLKQFLQPQADSVSETTTTEALNPAFHREREPGHVVAPCTTQGVCPLYRQAGKSQGRKDICHFHQRYFRPKFHSAMYGQASKNQGTTDFSYVVIQRGRARHPAMTGKQATATAFRGYQNANAAPDMQSLPRVVLPPLKRKGHVTMDVCTAEGLFERWTVPKSFSRLAYHDARKSRWGDLWALGAKTRIPRKVRLGGGVKPDEKAMRSEKKKARRAELTAEERRERRVEKKARTRDKRLGLIEEILEAEALEEEEMEREMDEELGMEGGGRGRRRRR